MQNGKGDKPRIKDYKKFRSNYDNVKWKKKDNGKEKETRFRKTYR